MVEGVQHGREDADAAEAQAHRDDAHVLHAVVGQKRLMSCWMGMKIAANINEMNPKSRRMACASPVFPSAASVIGR